MTHAFAGSNAFQIKNHSDKLIADFLKAHGDLAFERFDAAEHTYEQIIGAVESLPFLADKKMVVIYDLSVDKVSSEALPKLIERAGETTELLIIESKLDKRGAYYRQLKNLTDFHEYGDTDEASLAAWLVDTAKGYGAKLEKRDAAYLVQRVGSDQLRLSHELEKLASYNLMINRSSIELLTDENPSSTIFNLIENIFSGKPGQALRIYDEQRKQRVEPQAIHGMMVWQMHAVAIIASAPSGTPAAQIAKDSGISPYVIQRSQPIARKMGRQKIIAFMRLLRDIDFRGKHQTFDYDEALRYAILSLGK